jgi:hypothetical protein
MFPPQEGNGTTDPHRVALKVTYLAQIRCCPSASVALVSPELGVSALQTRLFAGTAIGQSAGT